MTKNVIYIYIGDTGTVTTGIYIEGAPKIKKYELIADNEKLLTNGDMYVKNIIVPEKEISKWREVDGQD